MLSVEPAVMVSEQPVRFRLPMETTPESEMPDPKTLGEQLITTLSVLHQRELITQAVPAGPGRRFPTQFDGVVHGLLSPAPCHTTTGAASAP